MKKWQMGGHLTTLGVMLYSLLFAFILIDLTFLVSIVIQNPTAGDLHVLIPLVLSPVGALFLAILRFNSNRR